MNVQCFVEWRVVRSHAVAWLRAVLIRRSLRKSPGQVCLMWRYEIRGWCWFDGQTQTASRRKRCPVTWRSRNLPPTTVTPGTQGARPHGWPVRPVSKETTQQSIENVYVCAWLIWSKDRENILNSQKHFFFTYSFFFLQNITQQIYFVCENLKKNHCPTLPKCEIYSWFLKWNSLSLCWFFTLKNSMIYPFSQSLVFIDRINRCMCMYFYFCH